MFKRSLALLVCLLIFLALPFTAAAVLSEDIEESGTRYKQLTNKNVAEYDLHGNDTPNASSMRLGVQIGRFFFTYKECVFINVEEGRPGSITWDVSEGYEYFTCLFGKGMWSHSNGPACSLTVYADDIEIAKTPDMPQMADPAHITVKLPEGTKQIRVECRSTGDFRNCSCVIARAYVFDSKEGLDLDKEYPLPYEIPMTEAQTETKQPESMPDSQTNSDSTDDAGKDEKGCGATLSLLSLISLLPVALLSLKQKGEH